MTSVQGYDDVWVVNNEIVLTAFTRGLHTSLRFPPCDILLSWRKIIKELQTSSVKGRFCCCQQCHCDNFLPAIASYVLPVNWIITEKAF